jgi:hypothetical protein
MLTIERISGLAGFGLPGSRVKSCGQIASEQLSARDQQLVAAIFAQRGRKTQRGRKAQRVGATAVRDGFSYRISRPSGTGLERVEVAEAALPAALISCVKDELV